MVGRIFTHLKLCCSGFCRFSDSHLSTFLAALRLCRQQCRQDEALAVNVSATQWHVHSCTCLTLCTMLTYLQKHVRPCSHDMFLTWLSWQQVEGTMVELETKKRMPSQWAWHHWIFWGRPQVNCSVYGNNELEQFQLYLWRSKQIFWAKTWPFPNPNQVFWNVKLPRKEKKRCKVPTWPWFAEKCITNINSGDWVVMSVQRAFDIHWISAQHETSPDFHLCTIIGSKSQTVRQFAKLMTFPSAVGLLCA